MQLDAEILDLLHDEMYFGIISAIQFFGPLNLKILAKVYKKSEATTLRKIKDLEAREYLQPDKETSSQRWGKFYKLTPKIEAALKRNEHIKINLKDPQMTLDFGHSLRIMGNIFSTVIDFMAAYIVDLAERAVREDATLEGQREAFKRMNVTIYDLIFMDKGEVEEYEQLCADFQQKIKKFRRPGVDGKYRQIVGELSAPYEKIHPFRESLIKHAQSKKN